MPKTKLRRKHVACLEGMWDEQIARPLNVRNLFETAAYFGRFEVAHLTCNTLPELEFNLQLLRGRRNYGILYLAFHGDPGRIALPSSEIELEGLADLMAQRFRGWVVHFGSCSTIDVPQSRLESFVSATEIAVLLGYRLDVDWVESASTDLLLMHHLQRYVDMRRMWKAFRERYGCLVERTGLAAYPA